MQARHPAAVGKQDLVVDRAQQTRNFIGRNDFLPLAANDDHLVPGRGARDVGVLIERGTRPGAAGG